MLNVVPFVRTRAEGREDDPDATGSRREPATREQLLILVNWQTVNARLIRLAVPQAERLLRLNDLAIRQMEALIAVPAHPAARPAAIGGDQHPDPPLPPRVPLRIVPRPVDIEGPDAIAA